MNFENLLTGRRNVQFKKMSRYMKYIFNDHFVIVMVFLLGALAYQYSEFLKTLSPDFFWGKIVVAILLSAAISVGKLSSSVEEADQVFLSSMEKEWQLHLKQSKKKSILFPGFLFFLLTGVSVPIIFIGQKFGWMDFLPIFLTALSLKWLNFDIQELETRMGSGNTSQLLRMILLLFATLLFLISFFINPWLAFGITLAMVVIIKGLFRENMMGKFPLIFWEKLIQLEENRVAKINRLINLFTDAPHVKNHAKRRKYLDFFVRVFSGRNNPYQYLYVRIFFRGNNYSGLFLRLTMIGFLVLMFTSLPAISLFLSILFLYLTGFQLIPLYFQLDEYVLVHLFPQQRDKKFKGFENVMTYLLFMESILFSLAVSLGTDIRTGFFSLLLNLFFTILFNRFYIGKRTKKHDN